MEYTGFCTGKIAGSEWIGLGKDTLGTVGHVSAYLFSKNTEWRLGSTVTFRPSARSSSMTALLRRPRRDELKGAVIKSGKCFGEIVSCASRHVSLKLGCDDLVVGYVADTADIGHGICFSHAVLRVALSLLNE